MQITIQVTTAAARRLHERAPPTPATEELARAAAQLGVALKPLHPGVEDPALATYFVVEVPDMATASQVMDQLQRCQAVEAAYVKPPDEMP